jgi:hypothetical protein
LRAKNLASIEFLRFELLKLHQCHAGFYFVETAMTDFISSDPKTGSDMESVVASKSVQRHFSGGVIS